MKIVIAPDSFKGTIRSSEVGAIVAKALRAHLAGAEIIVVPMADGGEGTTEAVMHSRGGSLEDVRVTGPLGEAVDARFGLLPGGRTAVLEMASASGFELVPPGCLDPMKATSYGTGELIRSVLEAGVREIILGIGGSATVDGGAGMAQALGYRLLDAAGAQCGRGGGALGSIVSIGRDTVDPALKECRIRVACDVTNPLLGEDGAARVFGPQKGATPPMVDALEAGLENLARVWRRQGMLTSVDAPGDGAAGGLGAGLRAFCGAVTSPGADLLAEITGFDRVIRGADLLITGEGRTDEQTLHGKLCSVLAGKARDAGARTILVSGVVDDGLAALGGVFDEIVPVVQDGRDVQAILRDARGNLETAAAALGRRLACGG